MAHFFYALSFLISAGPLDQTQRRHLYEQLTLGPNCNADIVLQLLFKEPFSGALVDQYIESRCGGVEYFFIDKNKKKFSDRELKDILDKELVMEERIALYMQRYLATAIPDVSDHVLSFARNGSTDERFSSLNYAMRSKLEWTFFLIGRGMGFWRHLSVNEPDSKRNGVTSTHHACNLLSNHLVPSLRQEKVCSQWKNEAIRLISAIQMQNRTGERICEDLRGIFKADSLCKVD